jgi:histidinol-phosphate aminotransferase
MKKISRRDFVLQVPSIALLVSSMPACGFRAVESSAPNRDLNLSNSSLRPLLKKMEERGDFYELSNNENPLGPSPLALSAMDESRKSNYLHRYSSHIQLHSALRVKVAGSISLESEFVDILPGTMDILLRFIEKFTSKSKALVQLNPDYYMMSGYARRLGHIVREIDVGLDGIFEEAKFLAHKKSAGMVYFSNPNNPLGTYNEVEKILSIVKAMPSTPVVVDEAYIHYLSEDYESKSLLKYTKEYKNLFVLRTYSKIYGLAGLRVGFIACHPEARKIWNLNTKYNWSVSSLSMVGVFAALGDSTHCNASRAHNEKMKTKVISFAEQNNLNYSKSKSLCVQILLPKEKEVLAKLERQGIFFNQFVTKDSYLRLTMGSEKGISRFLQVLSQE